MGVRAFDFIDVRRESLGLTDDVILHAPAFRCDHRARRTPA